MKEGGDNLSRGYQGRHGGFGNTGFDGGGFNFGGFGVPFLGGLAGGLLGNVLFPGDGFGGYGGYGYGGYPPYGGYPYYPYGYPSPYPYGYNPYEFYYRPF